MIREIVKFGDPLLREKCSPVEKFDKELFELLDDMYETMVNSEGVGIAAPQVGVLKRVIVIDLDEEPDGSGKIELINPIITAVWGKQAEPEGCLSFSGKKGVVIRPMHVRLKARDRHGRLRRYHGKELLARAFCHETDHLNGILFEDKVIEWVEEEDEDS